MIYFTLATALGIFLVYSVWVSSLGRHIATRGFERTEMPAGLRKNKWEILRQGTYKPLAFKNAEGIYSFVFKRDSGNMAIDIPCIAIFTEQSPAQEHLMALTDEMKTQYGTRFNPESTPVEGEEYNIYYFDDQQGVAEFSNFVKRYLKKLSIEVSKDGALIVTSKENMDLAMDAARSLVGLENR